MATREALEHAVARQLLHGLRESLTIAGQLGQPVAAVTAALHQWQAECDGCFVLSQPYADEDRLVITVVRWEALKRASGSIHDPGGLARKSNDSVQQTTQDVEKGRGAVRGSCSFG